MILYKRCRFQIVSMFCLRSDAASLNRRSAAFFFYQAVIIPLYAFFSPLNSSWQHLPPPEQKKNHSFTNV